MSEDPEARTRENLGWFYLEALRHIARRGSWPVSLTPGERRNIREAGLVELVYVPQTGWKPKVLSRDDGVHHDDR
jgi:hypothetical protein